MTAIVLFCYNRPYETEQVLAALQQHVISSKIYIFLDRAIEQGSNDNAEVLRIIKKFANGRDNIIFTYRDKNFGCKNNIFFGLTEVFAHEDQAVILEDDTVPSTLFFDYVNYYLALYKCEDHIWSIGGNNFIAETKNENLTHYLSKYTHGWGWATWADRWFKHTDRMIKSRDKGKYYLHPELTWIEKIYWRKVFKKNEYKLNTWDYDWLQSIWAYKGLSVCPSENLVKNIGFNESATHTKREISYQKEVSNASLILESAQYRVNQTLDEIEFKKTYSQTTRFMKYLI